MRYINLLTYLLTYSIHRESSSILTGWRRGLFPDYFVQCCLTKAEKSQAEWRRRRQQWSQHGRHVASVREDCPADRSSPPPQVPPSRTIIIIIYYYISLVQEVQKRQKERQKDRTDRT